MKYTLTDTIFIIIKSHAVPIANEEWNFFGEVFKDLIRKMSKNVSFWKVFGGMKWKFFAYLGAIVTKMTLFIVDFAYHRFLFSPKKQDVQGPPVAA